MPVEVKIDRISIYHDERDKQFHVGYDDEGRWCRWKDVEPYVKYCAEQGVKFDAVHTAGPEDEPGPDTSTDGFTVFDPRTAQLLDYDDFETELEKQYGKLYPAGHNGGDAGDTEAGDGEEDGESLRGC